MTKSVTTAARRQLTHEIISGGSGLLLALFMWGHVVLVGSILTGERGFDWLATMLEDFYIAQPTVLVIFTLFVVHAIYAARKIPAQLEERRRIQALAKGLRNSGREYVPTRTEHSPFRPHLESMLWIWQVRTGFIILVLGSFHLVLIGIDIFTPLFGDIAGIEAISSTARVAAGLWIPYAVLLLCVEFHASVGLYRLAIKWGADLWLSREALHRIEQVIFWVVLVIGALTLVVLAGWVEPPLAFLIDGGST
ncbi:MAG: hypothetical protein QNJ11_10135 [Woeseiaceae bacterium]|nr:hypothetical protein [Woeseiaceae bacterium]